MRRVLIVSPRFAPSNAPDMQRVRHSLPHFAEFGWEPTVLAVDAAECDAPTDPLLQRTIPEDVPVVRTRAVSRRAASRVGLGSFDLRALPYLARAGSRLLARERFDVVYFSTTAFLVTALGRGWRRRFGVPYVLDLQDPWRTDYYSRPGAPKPPGGRVKYALASSLARVLEPYTMRGVDHVISVSPAYPPMLRERYGWLRPDQFTVLPFGASELDFDLLRRERIAQRVFDPTDGKQHWVYAGVAPPSMALALRGVFLALARARAEAPARFATLRMHFVGTSYAPGERARKTVEPLADEYGVADLVEEHPARVSYFEALQCLRDADVLVLPGTDDPGYTASKLYPYILARKPLLAVVHGRSGMVEVLRLTRAGEVVAFEEEEPLPLIADRVKRVWFDPRPLHTPRTDWSAFEVFTAREMTRRQCAVFDGVADNVPHR